MTDTSGQQPEDSLQLSAEQEAHVRHLLAEARCDDPIPTDVAARLESTLAGLSRDDPGAPGIAPVVDLAARRRRRNAAAVLAGAAAVIVAGFTIGQVIDVGSSGGGGSAGTSAAADRQHQKADSSARSGGPNLASGNPSTPATEAGPPLLDLSSQHLRRDLVDQLRTVHPNASDAQDPAPQAYAAEGCLAPAPRSKFGLGELFPALFDGRPAIVALRPAKDDKQRADVLACDSATPLASATVPAR